MYENYWKREVEYRGSGNDIGQESEKVWQEGRRNGKRDETENVDMQQ